MLVMLNAYWEPEDFTLPPVASGRWVLVADTTQEDGAPAPRAALLPGSAVTVGPRSVVVASSEH